MKFLIHLPTAMIIDGNHNIKRLIDWQKLLRKPIYKGKIKLERQDRESRAFTLNLLMLSFNP